MRPTQWSRLVAVAAVAGALTWAGVRLWAARGAHEPPLLWTTVAALVLIAVVVAGAGWPVRQWLRGDRQRRIDALRAARTAVLGKASAYAGSLLLGWFGGQAAHYAATFAIDARRERMWVALAAALASLLMVVAGLLVERWCRVPPRQDRDTGGGAVADALD
ncbi:uncharacterized protein DUF3180 [Kineococcus xinjiangensis]|uniref:Uncharacterized protein DUF3180 n=1 Tax=Kineococcus xinjiangensis TaxID=512762 RepID=A0A2S6IGU0_9ACTN|nr:DUF3180 domain-containing protein [Kineococcus xinjiangensis]PPK93435.1 uncharacterized protein DUF3180 [Kineococcus xinjiangensis]